MNNLPVADVPSQMAGRLSEEIGIERTDFTLPRWKNVTWRGKTVELLSSRGSGLSRFHGNSDLIFARLLPGRGSHSAKSRGPTQDFGLCIRSSLL